MTLDEALTEAVSGARMTAAHMNGKYIEHSFSRGFLRCWPVDKPEDEPNRTQCDFVAHDDDRAALDWFEIEAPKLAVDHSPVDAWGKTTPAAIVGEANATAEAFAALVAKELAPMRGDRHDEAQALIDSAKPATTWGDVFADKTPVAGGWRTPDVPAVDPVPARDVWGVPKV